MINSTVTRMSDWIDNIWISRVVGGTRHYLHGDAEPLEHALEQVVDELRTAASPSD